MKKTLFCIVLVTIMLASCIAAPTPTAVANTPLPPAPPTSKNILVTQNNVKFEIPFGLASGASFDTNINVEYPYINPSNGDMPSHTVITLNDFLIRDRSARILVFKAAEYATYSELTQKIISALDNYPTQSSDAVPLDLQTTFFAQVKRIATNNTYGLRYLTQVMDAFVPINNADIFYYYQGLTADKVYLIQAIFPVNAEFLVADSNPASITPAEGVQFPIDLNGTTMQVFLDGMKAKLDATPSSTFIPSLDQLDALIQSIQVSP